MPQKGESPAKWVKKNRLIYSSKYYDKYLDE